MRRLGPVLALCLGALACEAPKPAPPVEAPKAAAPKPVEIEEGRLAMFMPPAPAEMPSDANPITPEKVDLGHKLFFDTRLSKNHDVSCNSCHGLETYGVDGKKTSTGHKGQLGGRNSPTVYHAAAQSQQFWDGRADTVEDQAKGPMLNAVEMAMPDAKKVEAVLNSMPEYVDAFKKAFPEEKKPVSFDNMAKAIGAFERKLVTPSRWDKFLAGDKTALTDAEKAGFNKFMESNCFTCHMGTNLGGMTRMKLGLIVPWPDQKDQGRYEVTKKDEDKMFFKVPVLRNVAKTAPYFHDGSTATLAEAIKLMGKHQLGKDLSDEDVKSIEAFLGALTGELPAQYVKAPELPKSTAKTPKADPT